LLLRANRVATGYVVIGGVARRRGRAMYPPTRGGGRLGRDALGASNGRRARGVDEKELHVGPLRMDLRSGRTWRGSQELALAPTGRNVLERLMRRPGEVVSRAELFADLAGENGLRRSVDVDRAIKQLRLRVDRPFSVRSIETVRGQGYRLRADGGQAPSRTPSAPAR